MSEEESTEQKILDAAEEAFVKEGYEGARMQKIANAAGINKAMLHYYFRSKELLFEKIFNLKVQYFFPSLSEIFKDDIPFVKQMEEFVERYITFIGKYPFIPFFIIRTINSSGTEAFIKKLPFKKKIAEGVLKSYERDRALGLVDDIDPMQFFLGILGMCIFPFLGKPILSFAFGVQEEDFNGLMERRIPEVQLYIRKILKP